MGLYIPNMEMPTSCAFCKIKRRNGRKMVCPLCDDEWDIHDPTSADFRLQNCPLIPVPPHGRTIDADALNYTMLYKENWITGTGVEAPAVWKKDIESAPIIIPAEPCKEKGK